MVTPGLSGGMGGIDIGLAAMVTPGLRGGMGGIDIGLANE
jgi:hypothetical protein